MRPTVVLVTGSRNWKDYAAVRNRLASHGTGCTLIEGECRIGGADIFARDWACSVGWTVVPVPYFDWLGARGGPERNRVMVHVAKRYRELGHRVCGEAFPIGESRGTRGCIELMKFALIPVNVTEG